MSAVQTTIQFKARKHTQVGSKTKREKCNNENEDFSNIANRSKLRSGRKRPLENQDEDFSKSDNESCSPTKTLRLATNHSDATDDISVKTKRDEEPLKLLTGRETEIEWLQKFLLDHLISEESASLYISGQPGTGKTASLSYILQLPQFKEGYKQVYINCTTMKSASSIYTRICSELHLSTKGTSEKACLAAIQKYFSGKHKMTLVVLDEMDQLRSRGQAVLYSIFAWAATTGSRLVLVGVANALDLPERALPRLAAARHAPRALHFAPYRRQQIQAVVAHELHALPAVFAPPALHMLAAKIAAVSGDMRRALDIGRRVIQLAERNKFQENQSVGELMNDSTVTVEIKQVLEVLNEVYGGSNKLQEEVDEGLPIHQKLILCSVMLILTKGKNKEIVLGRLYDVYKRVAVSRHTVALEMGEFVGACGLLEARGAVALRAGAGAAGGGTRARRLLLRWAEPELCAALRDHALLDAVLRDPRPLGNGHH